MNIPAEGTAAGDALALIVGLSPVAGIIISAAVKPRALAFFAALLVSGGIIATGVNYALTTTPGSGTELAAKVFGGWGAGLSLLMILLVTSGRALLAKSSPLTSTSGATEPKA